MDFKTALATIVKKPNSFTLFMAPLGWGKTRLLWSLLCGGEKIIIFSPFRAHVEEVLSRDGVISDMDEFMVAKSGIFVSTAEAFPWHRTDELDSTGDYLYVFDEFHLNYHWGHSFREQLLLAHEHIMGSNHRVLALSGTMEEEDLKLLRKDVFHSDKEFYSIDIGNMTLENKPHRRHTFTEKLGLRYLLFCAKFKRGRIIVFCRTKMEVWNLTEDLKSKGVSAQGCVGGGVQRFLELQNSVQSKVIVATSALSHGINIKDLRSVFINYKPEPYLLTQMEGRGGRFGERFNVYLLKNNTLQSSLLQRMKEALYQLCLTSLLWVYE